MSENNTTQLTVNVKDYGSDNHVVPQYGMRYPDGTIRWVQASTPGAVLVRFADLVAGNTAAQESWNNAIKRRAEGANINPIEYAAGHQLVKRTVIVAVTTDEEV